MAWLSRNWRKLLIVLGVGIVAATGPQTVAHRVADAVTAAVNELDRQDAAAASPDASADAKVQP